MNKKLLLLGQGRLASEVLLLMIRKKHFKYFDLKCLVTNDSFYKDFVSIYKNESPIFINNSNRNEDRIKKCIESNEIDIIFSIQHPWILSEGIIDSVKNKAFNLHNAKLPDYKGYNSISHSLINGDKYYYSTIHMMVDKADEGKVICESKIPIKKNDDALSLYLKTIKNVNILFSNFIEQKLFESKIEYNQPPRKGVFYKKNSLDELRDLKDINDSEQFDKHVRAVFFPPFEPAFIKVGLKKFYQIPNKRRQLIMSNIAPENKHKF